MEVENVEIERMRLHMERDGKGEMNCFREALTGGPQEAPGCLPEAAGRQEGR